MLRTAAVDDEFVSGIVPSQTVLWAGAESAPGALRELLAECGYALHGRDLDEWPSRRVAWLSPAALSARDKCDLTQRRLAVAHPDPGAADALAEALRARGAQVVVLSAGEEPDLDRAEALDPDAVILQPERFWPAGRAVINALWQHPWLRWTPVLFVPAERLGNAAASAPDVRELAQGIRTLSASYELCSRRASLNEAFEQPLALLGPVRTLRALLDSRRSLRLRLEAPERVYELDLGEGLVIGARVSIRRGVDWQELLGMHAVKSLLARMDGRIHVTPVEHPALTNVMAPLEAVLLSGRDAPLLSGPSKSAETAPAPRRVRATFPPKGAPAVEALRRVEASFARDGAATAQALPRVQATLVGMPVPVFARASQGALADAAPTHDFELGQARAELGEEDDASPTTAFRGSLQPSRPLQEEQEANVRLEPASRPRARVSRPARARTLAFALLAVGAGVLWTWPGAEQAPQPSPRSVPSGPPVSLPASAELAPRAEPMLRLAAAAEPTERAPKEARAKAQPARAKQLALKGQRLRKVGRLRAARQAYQAALVVQPGMPRALAGLVELQLAQHDAAQALETVQELLKHRQSPDDLRLLGDVYMLAGRREQALAAYHRAAARDNATARAQLKKHAP